MLLHWLWEGLLILYVFILIKTVSLTPAFFSCHPTWAAVGKAGRGRGRGGGFPLKQEMWFPWAKALLAHSWSGHKGTGCVCLNYPMIRSLSTAGDRSKGFSCACWYAGRVTEPCPYFCLSDKLFACTLMWVCGWDYQQSLEACESTQIHRHFGNMREITEEDVGLCRSADIMWKQDPFPQLPHHLGGWNVRNPWCESNPLFKKKV